MLLILLIRGVKSLLSSENLIKVYCSAVAQLVEQVTVDATLTNLGSFQQTKTLVLCKVLADKNDPVNYYDPYTLILKPMCSIIKMGDNLESDRYKKE